MYINNEIIISGNWPPGIKNNIERIEKSANLHNLKIKNEQLI